MKKNNYWKWTEEHTNAFNKLKEFNTNIPCLAHCNAQNEIISHMDASKKGLEAALCQSQKIGNLKPVRYASRFLSDLEEKYAINELELLAKVWGLEHFRLHIYGSQIELLTDIQALDSIIKKTYQTKHTVQDYNDGWTDLLTLIKNKTYCRQTPGSNQLFEYKSNTKAQTNRRLRRRIRNQLYNTTN